MSAIGPEAHAEFDRLSREALELDRCPVDARSHAVRYVYGESVCPSCDCDLRSAAYATAERTAARVPGKGCPGCAAATQASPVPTMCEPCRATADALDVVRERLRAQPLPAALQKPGTPHGPNRAQRRAAAFRGRRG